MKRGDVYADLRLKVYEDMKALVKLNGGKNAAVGCHGVKKLMINFILKNEAKLRERVLQELDNLSLWPLVGN